MTNLILINGCGGSGKDTTGRMLFARLKSGALLDIKSLIRVEPWEFAGKVGALGVRNAASLISNFTAAGYEHIVFSGGLSTQVNLDLLLSQIPEKMTVHYFWLDVPKAVRDSRRALRQRDEGDKAQHLDQIDSVFTDPGPLVNKHGNYFRISIGSMSPAEVVEEVLQRAGIGAASYV